jgi:hypothetical protein
MNKKKFLSLFLYVFLCLFFYLTPLFSVLGQENLDKTVNYICLKKIHCNESSSCTSKYIHRVQLSTDPQKRFPSNKELYIAECVYYTENNQIVGTCTTGSDNLDQQIFKSNNFSILSNKISYSLSRNENYGIFKIENNQAKKINPQSFTTNAAGETPVLEWQSYTPQSHERKWYGFFITQTQEEQQMGQGQGSLQQGKVEFPPFQDKDCATIAWDPAGRVFDAKTLEPIPNVQVMLLKNYNGQFADARRSELTIVNPYITLEDGGFSFYVSNGQYKLTPSHPNYSFPVNSLNEISKNYDQIYLNPRYGKPKEPKTLIYPSQTGEVITVNNRMEFRDIPLKPKNNVGYTYPLKIYSFNQQLNKLTQELVFSGKASHPFTKVTLYKKFFDEDGQEISQIYGTYLSDNLGKFSFSIPISALSQNETITDAQFEKSDLTNLTNPQGLIKKLKDLLTYFTNKVSAQQSNIINLKLNPVIPKVEGIAYDNSGKTLPNVKVGIYLSFSNLPFYTTTTDDNGYFKIPSKKLPNEPFEIRYQTSTGSIIKVSPPQFIKQNTQYLVKNNINLNQVVDEKGTVITPTKISPTKTKDFIIGGYYTTSQSPTTKPSIPSQLPTNKINLILLPLIILIILIISVAALLFFYYKKNRSQSQI